MLGTSMVCMERSRRRYAYFRVPPLSFLNENVDDPKLPPIPTRLALVKLFLELGLFTPALLVLHGVMASDDQDVEAWYLEGWCLFLMSEQAQEQGGTLDELTWQELGTDARDCLATCEVVCRSLSEIETLVLLPLATHERRAP